MHPPTPTPDSLYETVPSNTPRLPRALSTKSFPPFKTFRRRTDPETDHLGIAIADNIDEKSLCVSGAYDARFRDGAGNKAGVSIAGGVSDGFGVGGSSGVNVVVAPPAEKPQSGKRKRKMKEPNLLEGDMLVNTPKMLALVYSSLGLNALYLLQVGGWVGGVEVAFRVRGVRGEVGLGARGG